MAGGEVVTGARGTWPTGHGSKNRGHLEIEREQGNSPRPIWRPEGRAKMALTMASKVEVVGAPE